MIQPKHHLISTDSAISAIHVIVMAAFGSVIVGALTSPAAADVIYSLHGSIPTLAVTAAMILVVLSLAVSAVRSVGKGATLRNASKLVPLFVGSGLAAFLLITPL